MAAKKFKNPTEAMWAEIRTEYVRGDMNLRELWESHDTEFSRTGIANRSKREKWPAQRAMYQKGLVDEIEQRSVDLSCDGITAEEQADCRRAYRTDAQVIMEKVRAVLLAPDSELSSIDLQRLATTARTCQQIEFASLRIPIDAIDVSGKVEGAPMTWLDMMLHQREQKGLSKDGP